jgi:diketogulonate reductase-like aldo/keto reductase
VLNHIAHIAATTTLNNGVKMPWLGLGTWQASGNEVLQATRWALEAGYRHIDTAMIYGNEVEVGRAVRESGIPRAEIFVTTKVWNSDQRQGYDRVLKAFDESLKKLAFDTIDLYLVHWPVVGKYKEAWRALERIYADGRARAIGVSNFMLPHLEDLLKDAKVVPAVNQVEFHPRLRQQELLDFCAKNRIQHEAWSPLMLGKVREIPELCEIARAHGKTPEQTALRWGMQKGSVMIPKSVKKERIVANGALFDFELSAAEMARIDGLDQRHRTGGDPFNCTF